MPVIRLDEQLYRDAERHALENGYASVDDYVAEVLTQDMAETEFMDHLFAPERPAPIGKMPHA